MRLEFERKKLNNESMHVQSESNSLADLKLLVDKKVSKSSDSVKF